MGWSACDIGEGVAFNITACERNGQSRIFVEGYGLRLGYWRIINRADCNAYGRESGISEAIVDFEGETIRPEIVTDRSIDKVGERAGQRAMAWRRPNQKGQ